MATLAEIRQQYPQYEDMSDQALADALYSRFYSDMDRDAFNQRVGLNAAPEPMITVGERQIPRSEYMAMSDADRQGLRSEIAAQPENSAAQTQSSILDPFVQGTTFGWGDELRGLVQGGIAAAQGGDFGSVYDQVVDQSRNELGMERQRNPVGSFAAEAGGSIASTMLGGRALAPLAPGLATGQGLSVLQRALAGGVAGAAQGGLYGAGASEDDNRVGGALLGAGVGGAVGAAAPIIGNAAQNFARSRAQNRVIDRAIQSTPPASVLREGAGEMFDQVRQANTQVVAPRVRDFVTNAGNTLRGLGADRDITPAGVAVYRRMMEDMTGGNVSLPTIHVWRQLAGNAAASGGPDAKMGTTLVRLIDDFVGGLKPADLQFDPALFQGSTRSMGNMFLDAISTYHRAAKMGTLEQAIRRAAEYQSGFESGLRNQFANILKSPTLSRGFSEAEKEAMRRVSRGTFGTNILRLLGSFGIPTDQARNFLGAVLSGSLGGAVGGLPGAGVALGAGTAARAASGRLIQNAADRAVRVVGTPNLPSLPPINPRVPGALEQVLRLPAGVAGGAASR